MKKILLLALAVLPGAYAQCTDTFTVPYQMDTESVTAPELPNCAGSHYSTFSSQEIFETIPGPVSGFEGNVLAYNTIIDTEFMPPGTWVSAYLYSPQLMLEQGKNYIVSYKYGNSDSALKIDQLEVFISGNVSVIAVASHENITGAVATSFVSGPISVAQTGAYTLMFNVSTAGTQGLFLLDDITIDEAPAMGLENAVPDLAMAYPNPVKDVLRLNNQSVIDTALVYNVAGQVVKQANALHPESVIDMSGLQAGVYVLALTSGANNKVIKVIKD